MQGLRPRRLSQSSSRRKLHFDESKLGQVSTVLPISKRQHKMGRSLLKESPDAKCGFYADEFLSSEREQKQETCLFKSAATYKSRRSKKAQEIKEENFGSSRECVAVRNGVSKSLNRSSTQNSSIIDVLPLDEHVTSVRERVSRAANGSSNPMLKDENAAHHMQNAGEVNLAQANSSALNVAMQEPSSADFSMGIESSNFNFGDVGEHTQGSRAVDAVPLAQCSSNLDIVPLDEGLLSHAVDTAIVYQGPFPSFSRPSPEECSEVCYNLSQLHGPLEEYADHKTARISAKQVLTLEYHKEEDSKTIKHVLHGPNSTEVKGAFHLGYPRKRETVLDSLVGTMLSQNTTDTNSRRAFASLKSKFPTWEAVYGADPKAVEDAIRCGGLAEIKTSRILNILKVLDQEKGKLCLEYVRDLSVDQIKLELSRFKGVGPKTIACVLMFHLQQNEFPVDTHVFHITKMLGWVPAKADREKAYLHLNHRIPNELKFDLHCLLVTHGKRCPRCAKGGRTQRPADGPCPLVNLNLKFIEGSSSSLSIEP